MEERNPIRGFVCGVFDLFHYGHLLAFKECKEHCDILTVGVNRAEHFDPTINPDKKAPIFELSHRVAILKACNFVDEVVVYSTEMELEKLLLTRGFDVRFLGEDYKGRVITAPDASRKIHYLDRSHGLSTSYFRDRIINSNES